MTRKIKPLKGFGRHVLGVNYHPSYRGCYEWRDFREDEISADFFQMKKYGMDVARVFIFWPDFEPERGKILPEKIGLLKRLANIAEREGVKLVVTFFVGNMSGGIFDPPWRRGNIYNDPRELQTQVEHVKKIVRELKDHKAIHSWDVSNEVYWYGGFTDPYSGELWNRELYQAIREEDPEREITNGIDQFSIFGLTGFLPWRIEKYCDYMCVHSYPIYSPRMSPEPTLGERPTYLPAFAVKVMKALTDKPVVLQEFGHTTSYATDERIAKYMRVAAYSSLLAGSSATMPWCFSDFKNWREHPYNELPHEIEFGIFRADRTPKPQAEEMKKFGEFVRSLGLYSLEAPMVAILITPDWYHDAFRGSRRRFGENPEDSARSAFCAFIALRGLGVEVDLCTIDRIRNYKAVFIPSCKYLTVTDLETLADFVKGGGKLYLSYGSKPGQVSLGSPLLRELFGIAIEDRFPCVEPITLEFGGKSISLKPEIFGFKHVRSFVRASKLTAHILGSSSGMPAIFENNYGEGKAVFCAFPVEAVAMANVRFPLGEVCALYSFVLGLLNVTPENPLSPNFVEAGKVIGEDMRERLVLANHRDEHAKVRVATKEGTIETTLGPCEVKVIHL